MNKWKLLKGNLQKISGKFIINGRWQFKKHSEPDRNIRLVIKIITKFFLKMV